ncbi:MAG: putative hyperosmotically inducible periplasmic protein [Pseudomonadota bacterium]|jgi:hypothetical protein
MKPTLVIVCMLLASASCRRSEQQEEHTLPVLPAPAPNAVPGPPLSMEPLQAEDRVNTSGRDDGPAAGIDESAEHEMASSRELAAPGELLSDRAITQQIRQAVLDDGSFSSGARRIEIETVNGVVTLSGPVRTKQERVHLTTLASATRGVKRVDNQLQISGK